MITLVSSLCMVNAQSETDAKQTVLITGANRGLGLDITL